MHKIFGDHRLAEAVCRDEDHVVCTLDEVGSEGAFDGVTVDAFKSEGWWCNVRKSNTEPVIRIYSESETAEKAELLASRIMRDIKSMSV